MPALSLGCWVGFSYAASGGYSPVVVHGCSCSMSCGIFPDQGSDLRLLHWQADSLPLSPWKGHSEQLWCLPAAQGQEASSIAHHSKAVMMFPPIHIVVWVFLPVSYFLGVSPDMVSKIFRCFPPHSYTLGCWAESGLTSSSPTFCCFLHRVLRMIWIWDPDGPKSVFFDLISEWPLLLPGLLSRSQRPYTTRWSFLVLDSDELLALGLFCKGTRVGIVLDRAYHGWAGSRQKEKKPHVCYSSHKNACQDAEG